MSTLEKMLIFLFVAMTGVCIAFIVLYFVDQPTNDDESTPVAGSGCGGPMELSGESGTFSSLNYPENYKNGMNCIWEITVEPDKVVHLWFEDFSIGTDQPCSRDFITLQDSLGIIGRFCGDTKPMPLVSLSNRLIVYFNSNERDTDKGFKAHFKAVDPALTSELVGAGGFLQGEQGELMTPGFPEKNYSNSVLYQWKITVPVGERIHLTFNSLELVPSACGDYVQVYGGHRPGSTSLGKFCGPKLPKPLTSDFNTMVVRFKSDHTLTSQGFNAAYSKFIQTTVAPAPATTTTKTTTEIPATTGSGSVILTGRKGEIQSSGYPNPYPAHLQTSWKISVPKGFLVKLHITDLAITGETGMCNDDKLVITDAYSTLGTHCGHITPPLVVSASDSISVSFQSDNRLTDRGFSAKWEAVYPEDIAEIQGCGFTSKEETGVIKSQNWPMNYKANADCMWNIAVPVGKKIHLTFTDFDVEPADVFTNRCYDNIMVYDINSVTNAAHQKFGPFCGSTLPPTIETKGSRLVIRFQTDLFTEGKGFRAYWTTNPSLPAPTEAPVPPNPWDNITIDWPSTCGKPAIPPTLEARIVNGERAKPNSWPWQVSMQVWPDSRPEPTFFHTCGGTLIHKNWVMTAAHCFIRYADELQRWRMCLGKHNLTFTEPSERCFNVSGIYRHEGFKYPTVPTVEFDIALVRLDGDVTTSDEISFACLPSNEEMLPHGKKCYATGWGDETGNSMNATVAEALNQVALPVVEYDTCKRMDYWWFQVKTSMICCGYTLPDELKSVCQGDSGGPLVCQDKIGSPWEVHGITSFGPIGCVMNKKPSVFTRSSAYLPWIENVIRKDIYNGFVSGCGGPAVLNGTEGTVSSMGFPGGYSNKAKCHWDISVTPGKLVHLHFRNFSLEESQLCINDKLGISDQTGSLGTLCGPNLPQDLVSDGNNLHLVFSSNDRVVDMGFAATWRAIDPTEAPCGGVFSGNQGEMMSPNWPTGNYPALSVCTWRISIPSNTSIHVGFSHFDLQAKNLLGTCSDYVDVINGENMETLGRFCGSTPPANITIPSNTAVIRFLSDTTNQKKGFRGYWTTDASVIPTLPPSTTKP